MKYVSIDLETTGLSPNDCQILEFAAVIDDSGHPKVPIGKLPSFRRLVVSRQIKGEIYALDMNKKLIREIYDYYYTGRDPNWQAPVDTCEPRELGLQFGEFCQSNGVDSKNIIAAGKNFTGFDLRFLRRHPDFMTYCGFHHRSLDPAMYFLQSNDTAPPSTNKCLERAGSSTETTHEALNDAWDVVFLIRTGLSNARLNRQTCNAT